MNVSRRRIRRALQIAALAALLIPGAAYAVDGVVLIDQSKAMAGNVTPGDTPGFPVTISQPGSYRLDSNLLVPAGSHGIEIAADNVTIDLNGFTILGSATCVVSVANQQITCTPVSNSSAIESLINCSNITIRNGIIQGMPAAAILLSGCRDVLIDHLLISQALGGIAVNGGINAGNGVVVRDTVVTTVHNSTFSGGVIENSIFAAGVYGVYGDLLTIRDSMFADNSTSSFTPGQIVGFSGVSFLNEPAPQSGFSLGQNTLGGAIW